MSLLILAIAPSIALLLFVYFSDKYGKEPLGVVIKMFILGALTCIPSAIVEKILWVDSYNSNIATNLLHAILVVGLAEEGFKWLILYFGTWKKIYFSGVFDGILYAVFISLGFATVENILYVFNQGVMVGIMRAIISVPTHAMLGVIMGYYFGYAKYYELSNYVKLTLSILIPVLVHGLYDFLLIMGTPLTTKLALVLVVVITVISVAIINELRKSNLINFEK